MSFPLLTYLVKLDTDGGMIEWVGRKLPERFNYQFVGQTDHPLISLDSIRSATLVAARVYEVRPERAAHLHSPSHLDDGGYTMNCIGVDVSKQELVTYDGSNQGKFPNNGQLRKFTKYVDSMEEVLIVFEPTSTYSHRLLAFCAARNIPTCQLNPRVIPNLRKITQKRSKTDETDAELLYRYGVDRGDDEAKEPQPVDRLAHALSAQLALYQAIQKARVAYQGLLEAFSNDPFTPRRLLTSVKSEIRVMKEKEVKRIACAQAMINKEKKASLSLAVLQSVVGLGPVTSITLLRFFRQYNGANREQVVALAGLDPVSYQSGTSVHRKGRISKQGDKVLRKCLYQATLSAARYNVSVRAIYKRLNEAGKPKKVARIAAARKLLLIAHAVYKSGQPYRRPVEEAS